MLRTGGPRILIAGGPTACWINIGDVAVLVSMIDDLRRVLPDAELTVVSNNPPGYLKQFGVEEIPHSDLGRILEAARSSDLMILGGGSIFHDYWPFDHRTILTSRPEGLAFYGGFALTAALVDTPLMIYAVGVGPLQTEMGRALARMSFDLASLITVRDEDSREELVRLGIARERVEVCADPAFNLPFVAPTEGSGEPNLGAQARPVLGVALRNWDFAGDPLVWETEVAAAIDDFLAAEGGTALFLPFHQNTEWPLTDDAAAAERVRARIVRREQTLVISPDRRPEEMAGLIASCDLVLGMRLHAALFALNAGVPTVALSYDPKVRGLMRAMECEEYLIDLKEIHRERIGTLLRTAWAQREQISAALGERAGELRRRGRRSAELAADLIGAERRSSSKTPSPMSAATLELLKSLGVEQSLLYDGRGHRLEALEIEIARSRRLNETLLADVAARDRILAARDEALAWLRGELDFHRDLSRRLTGLGESLGEQMRQLLERATSSDADPASAARIEEMERYRRARDEEVVWLRGDLKQQRAQHQDLASTVRRMEAELQSKQSELQSQQAELEAMRRETARSQSGEEQRLTAARRMENDLRSRQAQVDELARILRARDDGINWLRGEVEAHRRLQEDLTSVNLTLNEEIGVRDRHLSMWRERAQQTELALLGVKISRGWKLLDRLRRVRVGLRELLGRPLPLSEAPPPVPLPDATPDSEWHERTGLLLSAIRTQLDDIWSRAPVVAAAAAEPPDAWTRVRILPRPEPDDLRSFFERETPVKPRHLPDVICFSIIDWEFRFQRPQQIMAQFAAHGHRVFYISTTRFQPAGSTPRAAIKEIRENIFEVQLSAARPPDVYGEVIGSDNDEELLASLDDLRRRLRIDEAIGYVMISSWGEMALEARRRWGWRLIYDCMDEWETFPGIRPALLEMERRLVKECDLLVVTAQRLYEKWEAHAAKMVLARNAADFDFYAAHLAPNHLLADARRPVVGYYGAIAEWFDLDLVLYLARARPDYTFVLIGGVFDVETAEAEALPNVRLLGQQPYERMPKYLYHFDACLIPFKVNPVTEATDPVKVYEYLSGGKPVVAVDLPELRPYADHLYLAGNREEFLDQLDRAVAEDDAGAVAARRALAREHTWAARYRAICAALSRQTPRASIVVITYNNLELNRLCLESILRNTEYPNYEVIVVDNNSTDGTPAYLRFLAARHPQVRVILNAKNEGFARANNQGIEAGRGEYIVMLNNDTVVPKGWLSRLLRHLRHAEVGMVGPVSNFVGNEARIEVAYETCAEMESFAADHVWRRDGEAADINMLAMFCVALRRSTYEEVGPLDEKFGVGMFEDDDYAHRLRARGYRVICAADVFVHHVGQASFVKLIDSGEYNPLFERNRRRFEEKWNVVWSPRSAEALDFRVDYQRRAAGG